MSSILPRNELENVNFCHGLLGQKFFVRFLGELKKPKSPFEINWPLQFLLNTLSCHCMNIAEKFAWKWQCSFRIYNYQLWSFKIKKNTKILHNCTHHQPHSSWKVRMKRRLTLKDTPVMELQVNHFQSTFYQRVCTTSHCCVEKSLNLFDKSVNWKLSTFT